MKQNAELLRKSITLGVSGIVYDCIPPIRLLLIRREKDPYKNRWAFPGGHLEYGETAGDAIKREIFEETGYKVFLPRQNFVHNNELISKSSHYLILSMFCVLDVSELDRLDDKIEKKMHNNIEYKFFYLDRRDDPNLPYFDDLKDEDCIPNLKTIYSRFHDRYITSFGI